MKNKIICSFFILLCSFGQVSFSSAAMKNSEQAPNHSLFDINQYKGKVVYLDFWASWCIPCRKSFPWMNKIQQENLNDLVIIAVNLDKKRQLASDFLSENPATFKIIYDPAGKLAKHYGIKGMPSSVIFDRNGKAVSAHKGFFVKRKKQYEDEIQRILSQSYNNTQQAHSTSTSSDSSP